MWWGAPFWDSHGRQWTIFTKFMVGTTLCTTFPTPCPSLCMLPHSDLLSDLSRTDFFYLFLYVSSHPPIRVWQENKNGCMWLRGWSCLKGTRLQGLRRKEGRGVNKAGRTRRQSKRMKQKRRMKKMGKGHGEKSKEEKSRGTRGRNERGLLCWGPSALTDAVHAWVHGARPSANERIPLSAFGPIWLLKFLYIQAK